MGSWEMRIQGRGRAKDAKGAKDWGVFPYFYSLSFLILRAAKNDKLGFADVRWANLPWRPWREAGLRPWPPIRAIRVIRG